MPSPSEANGRGPDGRFVAGNRFSRGNPHGRRVQRLRSALLAAVKPDDMKAIVAALIERAKAGDLLAIRELFDRTIGKATATEATDAAVGPPYHPGAAIDDADYVEFIAQQLAANGQVPRVHITYSDDWFGSRSANDAARKADLPERRGDPITD